MKKEKPIHNIHIGSFIRAKAAERGISETQLAHLINRSVSTINYTFKNESINTIQLWELSMALEYDFFTEIYGKSLPEHITNKAHLNTTIITISSEKVSVEQKNGITKITEYKKNSEK